MTNRRERGRQAAAKRNAERLAAKDAERQAQHKPTLYLGVQGDMNTHRQAANIKQQGGKVLQPIFFGLNEQGVVVGFDEEDFRKKGFRTTLFAHDITIALEVSIPNLIGRLTHLMMARQGAPLLRDMDSKAPIDSWSCFADADDFVAAINKIDAMSNEEVDKIALTVLPQQRQADRAMLAVMNQQAA